MAPKSRDDTAAARDEMNRGERFLSAYTVIEQAMRRRMGVPGGRESFRRMVDSLYETDWAVRKFRGDLEEFAELRNAIIHERVTPAYLIAVPLPETVAKIERIAASISDPPLVYPRFRRDVARFSADDKMEVVFRRIEETGYSQFPVYRGSVYEGLLTDGGIARWVAGLLSGAGGEGRSLASGAETKLGQVLVGEALKSEKTLDRARFISKKATVYEAEGLFRDSGGRDRWRVSALLITECGLPEESLAGIVTPSDILALAGE